MRLVAALRGAERPSDAELDAIAARAEAVGPNMHGQPPSITLIPCSRIVCEACSGRVAITTASTPPGIERRSR